MSETAPEDQSRATSWGPTVALICLACLVCLSTGLRLAAARRIPSPWFTPDEEIYSALGRSLYHSGRFEILGQASGFYSLVYPALAGLPLSFGDPVRGYTHLKALQALVMSLTAVPVYLWGRSLMSRGWALAAAALTLSIPGLAFSGFIMSEVAFYAVLVVAAWGIARALARPTLMNQGLAVAGIALAVGTRLQGVVLVPVLAVAIALELVFERAPLRSALRFAPACGGVLVLALAWAVVSHGRLLGEYHVVGETQYDVVDAARFVLYHAGDVLIVTAVLPAVAVALLATAAFAAREPSAEVRAYLAVTVALTAGLVAQVGLFASEFVLRLAERNLIGLAPLLFLGFALWLDRGTPRPLVPLALISTGAVGLLLALPLSDFVTEAAEPDAFTVIPLYQFHLHAPHVSVRLVVVTGAVALLVLLALVPARGRFVLPLVVLALLIGASISASSVVASQARRYTEVMVGPQKRWIDEAIPASSAVSYLYGGELAWSGGAPVWVNAFWNRRIDHVYDLGNARVLGPLPQTPLVVATPDGRLVTKAGEVISPTFVLAGQRIALVGTPVASSGPARLTLWKAVPPLRLASVTTGYDPWVGSLSQPGTMTVYSCSVGSLRLTIAARDEVRVEVDRNGAVVQGVRLAAGDRWSASVPGRPRQGICRFKVRASSPGFDVERFDFVRTE